MKVPGPLKTIYSVIETAAARTAAPARSGVFPRQVVRLALRSWFSFLSL